MGVWVGNNDNTPMRSLAGSLGAAPIWKQIMEKLHAEVPLVAFTAPSTIQQITLCRKLPETEDGTPQYISYKEYFLTGTQPANRCQWQDIPRKIKEPPKVVDRLIPVAQARQ